MFPALTLKALAALNLAGTEAAWEPQGYCPICKPWDRIHWNCQRLKWRAPLKAKGLQAPDSGVNTLKHPHLDQTSLQVLCRPIFIVLQFPFSVVQFPCNLHCPILCHFAMQSVHAVAARKRAWTCCCSEGQGSKPFAKLSIKPDTKHALICCLHRSLQGKHAQCSVLFEL